MFFLILICYFAILLRSFEIIYLFQIKEYRFDRVSSFLRETGYWKYLYTLNIKLPSKSFRNLMLSLYVFGITTILLLLAFEINIIYHLMAYGLIISPFIAFLFVASGIWFTNIPVGLHRNLTVIRAIKKLNFSESVFIGVTGSYGKSSVKEYTYELLAERFSTEKTMKNMNTDVGIALSILRNLKKKTEFFVTEFGAYREGEVSKIAKLIPLKYVILTGLGNQHLDLYGNRETLVKEETFPLKELGTKGTGYIPYDLEYKNRILQSTVCKIVTYGTANNADIKAKITKIDHHGFEASISYRGKTFDIKSKLLGEHSVVNLLPAIALSIDLGINQKVIASKIEKLDYIAGKLSVHEGKNLTTIINDAVTTNVDGFIAAIGVLELFPQKNKFILTKGIIELGVEKSESYDRILKSLNNTNIKLFTTDAMFKKQESKNNVMIFNDVSEMQKFITISNRNTIVLLEGRFSTNFISNIIIE